MRITWKAAIIVAAFLVVGLMFGASQAAGRNNVDQKYGRLILYNNQCVWTDGKDTIQKNTPEELYKELGGKGKMVSGSSAMPVQFLNALGVDGWVVVHAKEDMMEFLLRRDD